MHVNTAGTLVNNAVLNTVIDGKTIPLNSSSLTTQAIYTFVVLNTNDSGFGSLRQVILNANAHPGPDAITFDIGPTFPSLSIAPASPLPPVTQPVSIDATTQPGYAGTPIVELDGENAGAGTNGLALVGGGITVRGLAINRFAAAGVAIVDPAGGPSSTAASDTIQGDFIGTDRSGTTALPNDGGGLVIVGSTPNQIGGALPGAANLISGNAFANVLLAGPATGNVIAGNLIGPDLTGTHALSASTAGILIQDAHGNTIGGANVISGNSIGVMILGADASSNLVTGNRVGTDPTGLAPLGNTAVGVFVQAPANTISNNLISANLVGLRLYSPAAAGNVVTGNLVGTNATGLNSLGNLTDGIFIDHGVNNVIGGTNPGSRNVISGNKSVGVQIYGSTASGNFILGNYIGLNAQGSAAAGNGTDGVYIDQAPGNTIGGTVAGAGNVISGNLSAGIQIFGKTATGNVVQGNIIGTDPTGRTLLGNGYGLFVNDTAGNVLGGPQSAANTIRGNFHSNLFIIPSTLGPVVESVSPQIEGIAYGSIVVTFTKELDPASSQDLRNYTLVSAGADGRLGTRDDIKIPLLSATYTSGVRTVTLIPSQPLAVNGLYRLSVS